MGDLGPVLGDLYINLPVGVFSAWVVWRLLGQRESALVYRPIDRVGLVLLVVGVGALQLLLDRGKELDWFASSEVVVLGCVAAVALAYLVVWELTDAHPIIDLSLFRQRNFTVGVVSISMGYLLYFGTIVLLPLLF